MTRGRTDGLLAGAAAQHGARPALAADGATLTYAELDVAVDQLARRLQPLVGRSPEGLRVAVIAPNSPAAAIGLFAAWRAGGVAVPASARLRAHELSTMLAGCAAVLAPAAHARLLRTVPAAPPCLLLDEPGELPGTAATSAPLAPGVGSLLYTSGTSGRPKGALTRHESHVHWAHELAGLLELTPADRTVLAAPATHAFGLACLLASVAAGACTVPIEPGASAAPLRAAVAAPDVTVLHGSPPVFAALLASGAGALGRVRSGFVAGAPSPPGLVERLDAAGARILNLFGMTEIGAAASCRASDPPEVRHQTAGRPLPGYELRSVDGELQVRGPHVTAGYHDEPELTAAAFDGPWFRTGDLGHVDERGCLRVTGRAKDVVLVGGFSVAPAEVESVLMTHPDVAGVVVVGVPHRRLGTALKAFVAPAGSRRPEAGALLRFARPRIAGYKLPYAIEIVDELPRLASGKPDRAALEQWGGRP